MNFSIVEFTTEQTVEVVPSNWLLNKEQCWWPSVKGPKLQKLLTNRSSQPDINNGIVYSSKLIKTYENYEDAKRQLPEAEVTSNIDSMSEDDWRQRKNRKRKIDSEFIYSLRKDDDSLSFSSSEEEESVSLIPETKNIEASQKSETRKMQPQKKSAAPNIISLAQVTSFDIPEKENRPNNTINESEMNLNYIKKVLDEVNKMKEKQERFHEFVVEKMISLGNKVEEISNALIFKNIDSIVSENSLPALPIKDFGALQTIEEWLVDSHNTQILIQHLCAIGGSSLKDTTRRILAKVIDDDLATQINWTGKHNKFSLKDTSVAKVIISSARVSHRDCSEKEVEDIMKKWFRFSKDRNGGRDKRRNSNQL